MAKSNRKASKPDFTADDGFVLGVDMVRELRDHALIDGHQEFAIEQAYRLPGTRQRNLVAEYVTRIRATGSAELERGFLAFLTEYLSSCAGGDVPFLEIYEDTAETEVI